MRTLGLLAGLLVLAGGALPAPAQLLAPRIANGVVTATWPEVGVLLHDSVECSMTLVGCRWALTAAHCVCDEFGTGAPCGSGQGDALVDPTQTVVYVFLPQVGFVGIDAISIPPDYAFAVQGDIAVLHLAAPIRGVRPRAINELARPPYGTPGTIVGFGLDLSTSDSGLRREGSVVTRTCADPVLPVPDATHVCWNSALPPGPTGQSSTCAGDSGGPLLVDLGAGPTLAGVHSGGTSSTCQVDGFSFDTDVYVERDWLRQQAGADLDATQCGDGGQVGDAEVTTLAYGGSLVSQSQTSLQVPAGTKLLRVGLNATQSGDPNLYLRQGAPASTSHFDCSSAIRLSSYEYCEVPDPAPGTWYALADLASGSSVQYQLTATLLPPDPAPPPLAAGALLVTSFYADELVAVSPADASRAVASSALRGVGPALAAPEGLALDRDGTALVANSAGDNLLRVDPASGDRTVVSGCLDPDCASTRGAGLAFLSPRFVALEPATGAILVADRSVAGTYALLRIDPASGDRSVLSGCANASCTQVVGAGPAIQRLFGIAVAGADAILAVDGQALYRIDPASGDRTLVSGCVDAACSSSVGAGPIAGQPADLAIGPGGVPYVTYRVEGSPFGAVRRIDPTSGDRTQVSGCVDAACASSTGSGPAFVDPFGIRFDAAGALLVADGGLEAVLHVDPATGDRTAVSGCSDAGCPSEVGAGPGFGNALGLAVVPEPSASLDAATALAVLAAVGRMRARCRESAARVGA